MLLARSHVRNEIIGASMGGFVLDEDYGDMEMGDASYALTETERRIRDCIASVGLDAAISMLAFEIDGLERKLDLHVRLRALFL